MAKSDFGLTPIATAHPDGLTDEQRAELEEEARLHAWKSDMTPQDKGQRVEWLSKGRGRRGLRIVIVTGESLTSPPPSLPLDPSCVHSEADE